MKKGAFNMGLSKRYNPQKEEKSLQAWWQEQGTYDFNPTHTDSVYVIDTPPPTVSGHLHLGHVYSYSHADFFARFWRMNGHNVLYPMGFDDNGLPTERLVERRLKLRARDMKRSQFVEHCKKISEEAEREYEALWKRLALSIDWRYTYRTIDEKTQRIAQLSFLDLYQQGFIYRQKAPNIWCPECQTAIAQADVIDLSRESEFVTLSFQLQDGERLPIATTRPELLPACVAVFVHPDDSRFNSLVGQRATVPIFGQKVTIIADSAADPEKGTGAVMCCTFGDSTDVDWWRQHNLDLIEAITPDGLMTEGAGVFANLDIITARRAIKEYLRATDEYYERLPVKQEVRVHERCDTPVEYIVSAQWFIRILDHKKELLENGRQISWYPPHMEKRFQQWVENLNWDWCISRQRYYGVPFPVWYCTSCDEIRLASIDQLPIDPVESVPEQACSCGHEAVIPETDIMDTWATSSLTPQLVGRWLLKSGFDGQSFEPLSLRTQAHEIIRTWAFYSIVKAQYHFRSLPWKTAAISGWGLSPEGSGKISKSKGGGPMPPMEMITTFSADAVRYWAASTALGKDAIISQERIQSGSKLVTKLWNISRFAQRFIEDYEPEAKPPDLSPADRWILSRLQRVISLATEQFQAYDYSAVKSLLETFFWSELADNYIEMAKQRLYESNGVGFKGARYSLYRILLDTIKLFAPILPHVCEQIYQGLFVKEDSVDSIHRSPWPSADPALVDTVAQEFGPLLVQIATAVRRYKSNKGLSLSTELAVLYLATEDGDKLRWMKEAQRDISSITRAKTIEFAQYPASTWKIIESIDTLILGVIEDKPPE